MIWSFSNPTLMMVFAISLLRMNANCSTEDASDVFGLNARKTDFGPKLRKPLFLVSFEGQLYNELK